jgi:HEAT repeat protein
MVQEAAARSLERLEGLTSIPETLELLKKGNFAEKIKAIYALGEIGDEKVLPALIYCASRPEEGVKAAAIEVLGNMAHPAALKVLIERLSESEPTMRARTIAALGNYRDPALAGYITPFLDADDGLVEVEALKALAPIGDSSLEERFIRLLRSQYPKTREVAAWALGRLPVR